MGLQREQAVIAVSAPLMVAGLVAAALASDWLMRLGGGAMVIGGAVALGMTGRRARRVALGLALVGAAAVAAAFF